MTLPAADVAHLLLALSLLLAAAHGVGHLFVLLRQPRVIGEILGGILLGPTLFGLLAPDLQRAAFPATGSTAIILGAFYQLGLLLLMFCSGAEMRAMFRRGEERSVVAITITGVVLPFAAGAGLFSVMSGADLIGPADNRTSLLLVFSLAIAVTSIPVISRIMLDLGIIHTTFARIVLGVAVVEDTIVYIVLAVAIGLVTTGGSSGVGLPEMLGLDSGSGGALAVHVGVTLAVFLILLTVGSRVFRWVMRQPFNMLQRSSPVAYQLVFLFASTLVCVVLGITPLFGAFLAGIATSRAYGPRASAARESIKTFSLAFFVPVYFAIVGLQLDLVRHFDPVFFAWFLAFACLAKSLSVYVGGRIAGQGNHGSVNLAIAMNARGGPGIVLASVAYGADIINQEFYASLVMLAIVTSLIAGSYLGRVVRSGRPLLPQVSSGVGSCEEDDTRAAAPSQVGPLNSEPPRTTLV